MHYQRVEKARFIERPNRFVAYVDLHGELVVCHVKNTGRCRELLVPDSVVYLAAAENPNRKTKFDLIAVEKKLPDGQTLLINMDAQAPNRVFAEWAESGRFLPGLTKLQPEKQWGNSRFDFYFEVGQRRGFVEVKGVTLEHEGHASFPDAPTQRGVKHLEELIACQAAGYEAYICFVIQMSGVKDFSPNDRTHLAFGTVLRRAAAAGVTILARECRVTPDTLDITKSVPVYL